MGRTCVMRKVFVWLCLVLGTTATGPVGARLREPIDPPGPWQHPPELDKPEGKVVTVRTEPELQDALRALKSGTTVLVAPGTYELTNTLKIEGGVKNVALRGDSRERDKVVLKGKGMRNKKFGDVPHGIMVRDAT